MQLEFLHPAWLALALLAPVVWFWPRTADAHGTGRARWPCALRSLVIVLLAVGLARPALWTADERERALCIADLSPSVEAGARARLLAELPRWAAAQPARVEPLLIAIGATDEERRALAPAFAAVQSVAEGAGGSALAAALGAAARAIPSGARGSVTLASDGAATALDFGTALFELQERGLPVHVLELERAPQPARLARFATRELLRVGHSARLEVELAGQGADLELALHAADGRLIEQRGGIDCPGRAHVVFEYEPAAAGFVELELRLAGQAAVLRQVFAVEEPLEVLYVSGRVADGAARLGDWLGRGWRWTSWTPSDASDVPDLARYDLALLDDVPAAAVPDALELALLAAVRDQGLGLAMCGGEAAFGPGGWGQSPLAAALPVEAVQKEEKRDPSTTLVVIIDTSGSMGGERIQLAKEVARLALARLLPHDKAGIVEFYGAKRWALPIQPASNTIEIARALNRMDAGGGTVILPAIEEAFYGLQNVETRYKHVLVLTDGGVESGAFEPLLRRMADEDIAVSTVLIGPEAHSEFLVDIANWGKGRFYSVPDRFNLPEVLLKQPTSSRLPAYQPGTFTLAARGGPGWWGATDLGAVPPVAGYVETRARPAAEVLLEVEVARHPLLASWHHGLGRATALTTEPLGPGTAPWRAWSDAGRALGRVFARTAADGRARFALRAERRGRAVELVAERRRAGDERPLVERLDASGRVLSRVALEPRADGLFRGRLHAAPDEPLYFRARAEPGPGGAADEPASYAVSNARADRLDELAGGPAPRLDFERLLRAGAGERVELASFARFVPRAGGGSEPLRLVALAPWCFALALCVWLAEILLRRRDRLANPVA